jgi:primosomal protein N'
MSRYERLREAKDELAELLYGTEENREALVQKIANLIEVMIEDHESTYYHNKQPEY